MEARDDHEAAAHGAPEDGRRWIRCCVLSSEIEAQLVQGRLEAEGIACATESLVFHAEPVNFGALGRVRLYVLAEDLERAREILESVADDVTHANDDDAGEERAAADDPVSEPPTTRSS